MVAGDGEGQEGAQILAQPLPSVKSTRGGVVSWAVVTFLLEVSFESVFFTDDALKAVSVLTQVVPASGQASPFSGSESLGELACALAHLDQMVMQEVGSASFVQMGQRLRGKWLLLSGCTHALVEV